MTKTTYTYASRKTKTLAMILNIVGVVLAFIALIIELPRYNFEGGGFGMSDGSGYMDSYKTGLWDYIGFPIIAIILLAVACGLSCAALKKKTSATLPALIVSMLAYIYTDVLIAVFAPGNAEFGIVLTLPVLLVVWILFIVGHGKISSGKRHKVLSNVGFFGIAALMLIMCITQTIVSINSVKRVDYNSEMSAIGYGWTSGYELYRMDENKPSYDADYEDYNDNYALYTTVGIETIVIHGYYTEPDRTELIDLFSGYGISLSSDVSFADGNITLCEYVISYYSVDADWEESTTTYRCMLYRQVKYYESAYISAEDAFKAKYPDVDYEYNNKYVYKITDVYEWETSRSGEKITVYEVEYLSLFPNVFAYLATVCVALAFYFLGRSELSETVEELPDPQPIMVAHGGATGTGDANGAPAGATLTGLEPQNIVVNIILTVITCGIYGWVWFYRNAKRVRQLNGESTKGCGDELLLYIFGGVLYRMYWYYTRSKQINTAVKQLGIDGIFLSPMLYLLLSVFTPSVFQLAFLTANFNKLYQRACGVDDSQGKATEQAMPYLAQRHGLLKVVLLGLVTFGIYYVITVVRISNRIKLMQGKQAASTVQLICMLIVPLYWIIWLLTRKGKYHEGSNEATLEAWMLLVIPFYSTYWLITRTAELRVGAEQFGVTIAEESVWTLLFAMITPVICYANMLINVNRVADTMSVAG